MTGRGTAYLLLSGSGIPPTVFEAQVAEPLRDMARSGLVFDVLAYRGVRGGAGYRRAEDARAHDIRRALAPGRLWLRTVPLVSTRAGMLAAALLAAAHLWPSVLSGKDCVCHCRGHRAGFAGVWVKRMVPRCRIVFDIRGELSEQAELGTPAYEKLKRREHGVIDAACRIMCVSEAFRRRVASEYPDAADRVVVIPCTASAERFTYDPATRRRMRDELGLEDRTVVAYSGGLENTWQIADTIMAAFRALHAEDPQHHLLLMTPDVDLAARLASEAGIDSGDITITTTAYPEVPDHLMAADVGLLLRRRDPVNAVASPVKLAEYLMTGLPVVVSAGIGDSDELVTSNAFGTLVQDTDDIPSVRTAVLAATALAADDEARAARAAKAASLLSSERYLPTRLGVYEACRR